MSWVARHRRLLLASAALLLLLVGGWAMLTATVTTRQGIDYLVTEQRLPVYVKAIDFIHRHEQYALIVSGIAGGQTSDAGRALAVFDWTRRNIRRTPPGWPVVDDHVLHIIIRGHGMDDQQADVFATLTTYAGVPAFLCRMPIDRRRPGVVLSFARIDGRWRVFDVGNGFIFRNAAGALATIEELAGHPDLVPEAARPIVVDGVPYQEIVTHLSMPPIPQPLRAELQMPLPRIWHEVKAAARFESTE